MIRTRRKTLKMTLVITFLVLLTYYIIMSTKTTDQKSNIKHKFAVQKVISPHHAFRIVYNGETIVEEDFNHRPAENVFQPLLESQTLKLNRSCIGKQMPISFEGPSEKFSLPAIFRQTLSKSDKILFLYVFQKFADACETNKISFFMTGRTLIGSYRHHGFVPWDDGIVVFVDGSQKAKLAQAVDKLSDFQIVSPPKSSWKFFHKTFSSPAFGKPFRWPYVEIFFWATIDSYFYDFTALKKKNVHRKKFVFPLEKRPFEGALLPGPRNPRLFLKKNYNILKCRTNVFSRRHQLSSKWTITVSCRRLRKLYPFVKHYSKKHCREKLYFKNQVLNTFESKTC